ncbi:MAG: hypothetical protein ACREA9_22205 [Pyrinomonadaceae bacterium]
MKLEGESGRDVREWRERFVWLDPSAVNVAGEELHWQKLSQENARASFETLERLRPFLNDDEMQTGARQARDRIAELKDSQGASIFSDTDLRFFDLYFGSDHIRVDKVGSSYDVTNGRHRLWLARQQGVRALPAQVNELVESNSSSGKEAEKMGNLELSDVENEAKEQNEQADEMKGEVEQHKERAARLEAALRDIKASSQEIGSDEMKKAEASAEKAKGEIEKSLKEIKHRRDELLLENKELAGKVLKVNDGRRQAQHKVAALMAGGASGEFRNQVESINQSLTKDLANLAHAETDLADARKRLESLDV